MDAITWLRKSELFSALPKPSLEQLAAASDVRMVESGDLVVRAGADQTAVGYLAHGALAFYRRNKKRRMSVLLSVAQAPAVFGDAELAAGTRWMVSARAEDDCWCVWIPNAMFLEAVRGSAELATRLYLDAGVRHVLVNQTAQTLALHDIETRLLRLLLDYGQRYGHRQGDDLHIDRPLTQVGMAAALGVTRQTIKRTLNPLEARGIVVRTTGQRLVLHHLSDLEAELPRDLLGFSHRTGDKANAVTKQP